MSTYYSPGRPRRRLVAEALENYLLANNYEQDSVILYIVSQLYTLEMVIPFCGRQ